MKNTKLKLRVASRNMAEDIAKVSYEGQPESNKRFVEGYEIFMDAMPIIEDSVDLQITKNTMSLVSDEVVKDPRIISANLPKDGEFTRVILAMEVPEPIIDKECGEDVCPIAYKEGAEIVVALWGKGMKSPVHGHSVGYMHEELLLGKIKVNTYRIIDKIKKIVRRLPTTIVSGKQLVFVSDFAVAKSDAVNKRETLVHNFEALETSASLHYLPEHTRDGRDNTFSIQEFSEVYELLPGDVEQLTAQEALYLPIGEVALVRSVNVPEYGDHFIVYTGAPIIKEHGLRPQEESILASDYDTALLDMYPKKMGLTLLRLKPEARDLFLDFHGIKVEKKVIFPEA